jgi:glycosyltransferase involved in cell wall biosynthesis
MSQETLPALPLVSFIVPSYGRAGPLRQTVECALAQNYPHFEVIVVCQDPELPEYLGEFARREPTRLRFHHQQPAHANRARNKAVEMSRGEILLSLDDDVLFGPDYASRHVARYADAKIGFVMSLTLEGAADTAPAALIRTAQTYGPRPPLHPGEVIPIDWAPTCSTSYRRSALVAAGPFDDYFTGGVADDTDIAIRIRDQGYQGILDSAIQLVHLAVPSGGFASRDPNRPFRRMLNDQRMRVYFTAKHAGGMGFLPAASMYWSVLRATVVAFRTRYGSVAQLAAPFYFCWMAAGASYDARRRLRATRAFFA